MYRCSGMLRKRIQEQGRTEASGCNRRVYALSLIHIWRQADTYNVPRMAFINKMDILGADFYGAVEQIKTRLGKNAICLQLPIGKEDEFKGIIDLFEMKAYIYNDEKGEDISKMCIRDSR